METMKHRLAVVLLALWFGPLSSTFVLAEQALTLWYDRPAVEWTEALPIGNGRLGAMVFGGTEHERIQFNDDTLFTGRPHDFARDGASKYLPVLRQLLFDGKQQEAHELANREFMSNSTRDGSRNIRQEKYQPFGDLILEFPGHDQVTEYRRELDIDRALASVKYKVDGVTFRRDLFASYPDNVIAVRITCDQPGKLNFNARLATPNELAGGIVWTRNLTIEGVRAERSILVMGGKLRDGDVRFEAQLVVHPEGEQNQFEEGDGTVTVRQADAATLLLVGSSSFVNFKDIDGDPSASNERTIKQLRRKSYDELLDAHVGDYQQLFQRVTIDLGRTESENQPTDKRIKAFQRQNDPQLAALYFQFGRYLLIASSRPGDQPANLQGIWNESLEPPWDSKYTININTEMNYWPAELTEPLGVPRAAVRGAEGPVAVGRPRGPSALRRPRLGRASQLRPVARRGADQQLEPRHLAHRRRMAVRASVVSLRVHRRQGVPARHGLSAHERGGAVLRGLFG